MSINKVVLVGGYPPPFGGINVHIQRLAKLLNRSYEVKVFDIYGKPCATDECLSGIELYRLRSASLSAMICALRELCAGQGIVHLHVSTGRNMLGLLFFVATKLSKKLVLTIHGGNFAARLSEKGPLTRSFMSWMLRAFDWIILVNPEQKRVLEGLRIPSNKITIIPAYLKADMDPSPNLNAKIAGIKSRNELVLISSGYGLPHYGYHEILQALARTYRDKKVALILALYNSYDGQYLNELDNLATTLTNVEFVMLQDTHPDEFNYLLQQCDTYIRATTRDGDSVAVRESLEQGLNVICSDCVARPMGAVLFPCNSVEGLSEALRTVCNSTDRRMHPQHDNAKEILEIYETVR